MSNTLEWNPVSRLRLEGSTARGEIRRRSDNRREEENPGGLKTQESYALGFQSKPLSRVADSRAEQDPEDVPNVMRGAAPETAHGCVGGVKLWRVTPRADPA